MNHNAVPPGTTQPNPTIVYHDAAASISQPNWSPTDWQDPARRRQDRLESWASTTFGERQLPAARHDQVKFAAIPNAATLLITRPRYYASTFGRFMSRIYEASGGPVIR